MRCTDIQINDWVYLSEKTKYPMRVTEIDKYNCSLDFEGNEADPFDGIYGEDGIAPIELTAEILSLNCWVYDEEDGYWSSLHTYKMAIEESLTKGGTVYTAYEGEVTLTYVHELQHLLRLCGLHDMADNFKIEKICTQEEES